MNKIVTDEELSYTSRAILVGSMIGGTASVINQWKASKAAPLSPHTCIKKVTSDTLKAGAVSGMTTYAANKMIKKPILSMATILAVGIASAYLLSAQSAKRKEHE